MINLGNIAVILLVFLLISMIFSSIRVWVNGREYGVNPRNTIPYGEEDNFTNAYDLIDNSRWYQIIDSGIDDYEYVVAILIDNGVNSFIKSIPLSHYDDLVKLPKIKDKEDLLNSLSVSHSHTS